MQLAALRRRSLGREALRVRRMLGASSNPRHQLITILSDGNTLGWYKPGVGVTGTMNASAWANQMGAAPSLAQATGAAQPIYMPFVSNKYGYLPGVSGNSFSTPNAVPIQIIGSIRLEAYLAMNDWTPPAFRSIISKSDFNAGNGTYVIGIATDGKIHFAISTDGTYQINNDVASSVAPTISDGSGLWIAVDWVAGTKVATFFTSTDGLTTVSPTWAQLGTTATTTDGAIANKSTALFVGQDAGGTNTMLGHIYRARVWSGGLTGTLVAEYKSSDWSETSTNGTTQASSTTGEVWTLNNTAIATPAAIVGSPFIVTEGVAMWMRSTFTANQPLTYYIVGMDPVWNAGKYVADGVTANTLGLSKTTGTPKLSLNAGSAAAENAGFTLRAKHILTAVLNGASSSTAIDSVAAVTGDAGAGNPGGLTIGADGGTPTAGTFGGFWFSEIIVRSGVDSAAKQLSIQTKLKQIHGTP